MSDFKCTFCPRTFANRNGLAKHISKCLLSFDEDEHVLTKPASIRTISNKINKNQNVPFNNQNKSESKFFTEKMSFKDINFRNISNLSKQSKINSNIDLDDTLAGPSDFVNTDYISGDSVDMLFEVDVANINSNYFDSDPTFDILDDYNDSLHNNQEFSNELLNNSAYTDDNQSSSEEEKEIIQKHDKFPNEAYADLMVLVTKFKLSNTAGNAIISFFNKHSNHKKSPLPKNIKQGKEFMNNINSNLSYKKTKVLDHDNTEYFLYHMPLISCIENILEIPDIAQNLEFEYKELYKTTKVYITFNIIL